MPILGNLSEFPLPEVLLLIGTRTGRLRLLDVPEFGIMEIDFSNGEVQSMHLGNKTLTDSAEMVSRMSSLVQSQGGMFEFKMLPVESVPRDQPLMVNQMVMTLVCHVDQQMAQSRKAGNADDYYVLEMPQPEIWVEPELNDFFLMTRQFLTSGTRLKDLVDKTGLSYELVQQNITNLRLLGVVKMMNAGDSTQINEAQVQDTIARKSNEFLRASRAATQIKSVTAQMPKLNQIYGEA